MKRGYYERVASIGMNFDQEDVKALLQDPMIERYGVKRGDLYCILFKEFANNKLTDLAFVVYQRMKSEGIHPQNFLSKEAITVVLEANGIKQDDIFSHEP